MSQDPADSSPPSDPKVALEDELIVQAMEPYRSRLRPEEFAGMRLFLRAFVKTHPAMQSMIARRLTEDAAVELAKVAASAARAGAPEASGVVPKEGDGRERDGAGGPARAAPEASGVVAKDPNRAEQRKGQKGG